DERRVDVDAFFAKIGSIVAEGAGAAFVPSLDVIEMPVYERFTSAGGYYATLAHEHVHWTGHPSRLDREMKFRGKPYAFEELIA
ncbi:zincin-like metallopeptidase domain-containing protein, partial [Proteus mirabilis]|uniref:zincin-like metallopeptidase domain-containing protein n=1 Tax=Proteus mirabilis TaxID=584 RepID=UPI002576A448